MKKSRFREEQIIGILRDGQSGMTVKAVCAKHNVAERTYYGWKRKYEGMEGTEVRKARALEEENGRLEEAGGRPGGADSDPERGERKKMVSPSAKRRAVKMEVEAGVGGTAGACRALGLARSSYYRISTRSPEREARRGEIVALSEKHPRYGYRRITAMLDRAQPGRRINVKAVQRVRSKEGLQVRRKQRRMKRLGLSTSERQRAQANNAVWSWDFVYDQTENGESFRVLTLIDEYNRRCLATHVGRSIKARDVITVVEAAFLRYGKPLHLRSDRTAPSVIKPPRSMPRAPSTCSGRPPASLRKLTANPQQTRKP
ncbi:MAG: IS3 family transposase [Terrimicrobiaceae bacterium]|nr:IS3 family transposase [Terrimicrobiaceae bacterium]